MGTASVGAAGTAGAGAAPWRVPVSLALAVGSLPLAVWYGYGTVVAVASLVVLWPAWREGARTVPAWAALLLGVAGLLLGAFFLVAAVGLCGPRILIGVCDA